MSFEFISTDVWAKITKELSRARSPCEVAVAYLGKGGASLLPIPAGSRVVVDASLAAVKSGQTHPLDLLALHRRGVGIYSSALLHAKVFVGDSTIIVGSANASRHSARVLLEAVVRSAEPDAVEAGREFVARLCVEPLGPTQLKRLQRHYRPPRTPGHKAPDHSANAATSLYVAKTFDIALSQELETESESGQSAAKRKLNRARGFDIEHLLWDGTPPFKEGQLFVQVRAKDKQSRHRPRTVGPPGRVIHISRSSCDARKTHVYVEIPNLPPKPYSRLSASVKQFLSRAGTKNTARSNEILALFRR